MIINHTFVQQYSRGVRKDRVYGWHVGHKKITPYYSSHKYRYFAGASLKGCLYGLARAGLANLDWSQG
jgi:hypothetical protein